MRKHKVAFVLPGLDVRGGLLVALEHVRVLRAHGHEVTLINDGPEEGPLGAISRQKRAHAGDFDLVVATLWSTTDWVARYPHAKRRAYLVQGFETDFTPPGHPHRIRANATYSLPDFDIITVSAWCQRWLAERFDRNAALIPNGLHSARFKAPARKGKPIVLIEGNPEDANKNVDESFRIVDGLPVDVWLVAYAGRPKPWHRYQRFFQAVPHEQMPALYAQAHYLVKSSVQESFSYAPLEMMASGGVALVAKNAGNAEYLADNALTYELGDVPGARALLQHALTDRALRRRLVQNGLRTAKARDWKHQETRIIDAYFGPR